MSDRIDELLATLGKPRRQRRLPPAMVGLSEMTLPSGRLFYEVHGEGPPVLLVHGWESSAREFSSMIPEIEKAGARVIAPDLPGHGASEGETVNARIAAEALLALDREEGPFVALLAHSFGCPATMLALEAGLRAKALVFFAPPARQADQFRQRCERTGLTEAETESALARVKANGGSLVDIIARAPARTEPLLIIHSRDDERTPLSGSEAIIAAWPGAKLLAVEGLGHNLALRDRMTIAAALRFTLGV
ncbi:MAG: alpha/beta fold hydrolase [Alphaproteobacteria bacterium]|nr:alpha/beta fold hydrolase [Alphaproteobacteria bacterium]